ncbi:hypothetical protein APS56_01890 [Pseudalgibacter alginicilyticus]|uniref:Secretion system C-terminal sorting domain-containing protein n=1 Tax=Pseudalgibacter alginicilyticus TaxID=1736674 RepID=A0A0P0D5P9_9FLAO|nr:T9SS type A sorting domain-containing protein [Pseudalgibacter alginicilyticus]ALJ03978.1 hypothetical protein APS56_01890 [Pseudalgibacter alginicilyticus]
MKKNYFYLLLIVLFVFPKQMNAQVVTSVLVPANNTYVAGENLDFTIKFDVPILVSTTLGTPQLSISVGATTQQAIYVSGSGTTDLLFRYTVQAGDLDTDGITVGTLSTNGGTLLDVGFDVAILTLVNVGSTVDVLVDAVLATVTSVLVPAADTYTAGENLEFTVSFSKNITVSTAGGIPQLSITVGAATQQAIYVSGSGTSDLLFRYTVQAGDLDTDGITVETLSANGGTLLDAALNAVALVLNSVGDTTGVIIDTSLNTNDVESKSNFSIYPNPGSENVYIKSGFDGDFQIINQLGQIVKTIKAQSHTEVSMYVGDLKEGLYFINAVNNANGSLQKLVIKK